MTTRGGKDVVRLADLWVASGLAADAGRLSFDFVGDDGFSPFAKRQKRLDGALVAQGYVELPDRRLVWEESLALPCFFRVRALARVVAEHA